MNRFKAHPTPNPDSLKVITTTGPFTDRPVEPISWLAAASALERHAAA